MTASTTMTIRISDDLKHNLTRLAHETRRSNSFLAGAAVQAYVAQELAIIDGVHRGMADVAAGRTVPHDAAMDELDAIIAAAR
jgi:predicted transcriptional regulator